MDPAAIAVLHDGAVENEFLTRLQRQF